MWEAVTPFRLPSVKIEIKNKHRFLGGDPAATNINIKESAV
jgi:hypothetical protein